MSSLSNLVRLLNYSSWILYIDMIIVDDGVHGNTTATLKLDSHWQTWQETVKAKISMGFEWEYSQAYWRLGDHGRVTLDTVNLFSDCNCYQCRVFYTGFGDFQPLRVILRELKNRAYALILTLQCWEKVFIGVLR